MIGKKSMLQICKTEVTDLLVKRRISSSFVLSHVPVIALTLQH